MRPATSSYLAGRLSGELAERLGRALFRWAGLRLDSVEGGDVIARFEEELTAWRDAAREDLGRDAPLGDAEFHPLMIHEGIYGVALPKASDDLAQMAAVLAAEGYAWVHPLDGSPKRLERVARPADDVRAILEGAARGQFPLGSTGETGSEAIMPLIGELRALRLDMDALREAERRREAAARDAADVLDAAARGPSPKGAPTRGEGGE